MLPSSSKQPSRVTQKAGVNWNTMTEARRRSKIVATVRWAHRVVRTASSPGKRNHRTCWMTPWCVMYNVWLHVSTLVNVIRFDVNVYLTLYYIICNATYLASRMGKLWENIGKLCMTNRKPACFFSQKSYKKKTGFQISTPKKWVVASTSIYMTVDYFWFPQWCNSMQ